MIILFNMPAEGELSFNTKTGSLITIYLEGGDCDVIAINGHEFDAVDDVLYAIFVNVNCEFQHLKTIINYAESVYSDVLAEYKQDQAGQSAIYEELSCPRATGRI